METIRLIFIVALLVNAPAALTFELRPVVLEVVLTIDAFFTLLIEAVEDH